MPIRAELRHHYESPQWLEARDRCLARAGNRCEVCSLANGLRGFRLGGAFHMVDCWPNVKIDAVVVDGRKRKLITVQVGVGHLNHVPGDDRPANLRAMCRRCHLLYDADHHRETRATRKDAERPILAAIESGERVA